MAGGFLQTPQVYQGGLSKKAPYNVEEQDRGGGTGPPLAPPLHRRVALSGLKFLLCQTEQDLQGNGRVVELDVWGPQPTALLRSLV